MAKATDNNNGGQAAPARKTVEELAAEAGTPDWLLAAARAKHRWVIGQELTKAAFERGIQEAANEPIGGEV
ncbi:hypothetical protein Mesil_1919 [Allomeiothermus silvanus DSM 9946]|uniref:Uncharacterized protein n=1 Tax=Allomeiothermus silvanus (strain ATCC 700542 / DSM 9946 / NBRC 106475 / NCIMB 13440 / VI-R2) TaxID=526227 RepID=D7BGH8_ALLS1|nr:hypothetical protein [Allomeiothermus silvanus]ADH63794.1 hypothetical protein Mesil_1919 [Allomeiothermus silvanus DSM 9946]